MIWQGYVTHLIPLFLVNCANCADVNCGPLSVTKICGNPKVAKVALILSIVDVTSAGLELTTWMSTYLVLVSSAKKQSIHSLCRGFQGRSQGCKVGEGGL